MVSQFVNAALTQISPQLKHVKFPQDLIFHDGGHNDNTALLWLWVIGLGKAPHL